MATKYGYVQRDPQDTQLNWSQIATDTVDMLNAEVKTREDKKAAIDQATADYQTILNNVPQGENTQLNEFALNAAEKLQKQMLMQETLLKSGQLNPKQYTIMRQNLSDGTDQAFSLMQDYNDEYSAKMAMMSADLPVAERASQMQTWMMEQVEGFSNFTSTELVVNPQTGIMSMAKLIPDPKYKGSGTAPLIPDPDPNNLVTVQQLQNRIKTKYTQYDVVGNAEEWVKTLGEDKRVEIATLGNKYQAGIFKTVKDIRNREGGFEDKTPEELEKLAAEMGVNVDDIAALSKFEEAQNTFIKGQLFSNSNIGTSVLLDFARQTPDGKPYELTFDPDAAAEDESIILLKSVNGRVQAELTDAQEAVATETYKAQIDIGLDIEETVEVRQVYKDIPKTAAQYARADAKQRQASVMTNIGQLYAAETDAQVRSAGDFLKSISPRDENGTPLMKEISRTASGVVITYSNGSTESLDFYAKTQRDWSRSVVNYFLDDKNRILNLDEAEKAAGVDLSGTKPSETSFTLATTIPTEAYVYNNKELTFPEAVEKSIDIQTPSAGVLVKDNDYEKTLPAIQSQLPVGYSVDWSGTFGDYISFYKGGSLIKGEQYSISKGADKEAIRNAIIKIKLSELDTEQKKYDEAEKLLETVTNKKGEAGAAGAAP
tara:strand:+ start:1549 stop:3519 length:1971 start_codon:yes stop_codon:yes gene_type:complete